MRTDQIVEGGGHELVFGFADDSVAFRLAFEALDEPVLFAQLRLQRRQFGRDTGAGAVLRVHRLQHHLGLFPPKSTSTTTTTKTVPLGKTQSQVRRRKPPRSVSNQVRKLGEIG